MILNKWDVFYNTAGSTICLCTETYKVCKVYKAKIINKNGCYTINNEVKNISKNYNFYTDIDTKTFLDNLVITSQDFNFIKYIKKIKLEFYNSKRDNLLLLLIK